MNNPSIRPFNSTDISEVVEIIRLNLISINSKYYPKEVIDFMLKYYGKIGFSARLQEIPNLFIIYNENSSEILGVGGWKMSDDVHNSALIRCMFIKPSFQSKGLGNQLLIFLEEDIKKNNVSTVLLDSSLNAREFYENNGYQEIGFNDLPDLGKSIKMRKILE